MTTRDDSQPGPGPATESASGTQPTRRRLGCLIRLTSTVGLFLLLFPFALIANVTQPLGGIRAWFDIVKELVYTDGRFPAGGGGEGFLVAIVLIFALFALHIAVSILQLVLESLGAVLVAVVQTLVLVYLGRAFFDVFRLRGSIARDDASLVRKWGARGAILALALWLWVVILVPLLSQLGEHPTEVPTAGHAVSLLAWLGVVCVTVGRLVGRLRRTKSA